MFDRELKLTVVNLTTIFDLRNKKENNSQTFCLKIIKKIKLQISFNSFKKVKLI